MQWILLAYCTRDANRRCTFTKCCCTVRDIHTLWKKSYQKEIWPLTLKKPVLLSKQLATRHIRKQNKLSVMTKHLKPEGLLNKRETIDIRYECYNSVLHTGPVYTVYCTLSVDDEWKSRWSIYREVYRHTLLHTRVYSIVCKYENHTAHYTVTWMKHSRSFYVSVIRGKAS